MLAIVWFILIVGATYLVWRTIHNDRNKGNK